MELSSQKAKQPGEARGKKASPVRPTIRKWLQAERRWAVPRDPAHTAPVRPAGWSFEGARCGGAGFMAAGVKDSDLGFLSESRMTHNGNL